MTIEYFKELLANNNAIRISDEFIVFNDNEVYSFETEKGKKYNDIDELVADRPDIAEIIESTEEFDNTYDMAKGSRGGDGKMGGGFNHASNRGGGKQERLLPAELNLGTARNSLDKVLKRFQNKYADADREYGISIDDQGFVHQHIKGGGTSVAITGNKGETIIHNHPSGGNFSDSDLIHVASTQEKVIIATSSNTSKKTTFKFEKTPKFK